MCWNSLCLAITVFTSFFLKEHIILVFYTQEYVLLSAHTVYERIGLANEYYWNYKYV